MKPEELLEALLDYGVFADGCEDDYGRKWYPLGDEPIGDISGKEWKEKWGELSEYELISQLKQFLAIRKL